MSVRTRVQRALDAFPCNEGAIRSWTTGQGSHTDRLQLEILGGAPVGEPVGEELGSLFDPLDGDE